MSDSDDVRYGVFLVPDARTSAAITDITGYLRSQFGLVSAGRFPPHVTLAGSLAVNEADLLAAVNEVADRHHPLWLSNQGVHRLHDAVLVFDVHHRDVGEPNELLVNLAADVNAAVQPLLRPTERLHADVHDRETWRGHLSLASHELAERADLSDEVEEFIGQLGMQYPKAFRSARLAVYRLHHPDWSTGWWTDFWWEHVRSFRLAPVPPT